jgi:hypothetical protein
MNALVKRADFELEVGAQSSCRANEQCAIQKECNE